MATKTTVLKLRSSSTAGKVPTTAQITTAEVALNLTDKKLYSSDGSTVFQVAPSMTEHNAKQRRFAPDPIDSGATGNGSGNDQPALAAAQATAGYGKSVLLTGDYLVSAYSNPYGNTYSGPGRILTTVTGGFQQRNTYADNQRLHIGHEYLNRCFQYIRLGQGSPAGTMKIVLFGDSTVQGGYGEDQKADVALSNALVNRGLPNHVVYNQGVSGTKWGDLSALSALTNGNALFVIKYGINDAGYGLAQLAADMDAKLAAIRAAAHGGLNELAILLVGPNATSDTPNGRDERWYEQIRGIYVAAARKHNCAYFDTYAHFQDSRPASTLWLDNSFGDLRGIHPIQAFNARIWGAIVDEFFSLGQIAPYQANAVSNEGAVSTTLTATTPPGDFNYVMRLNRAPLASGWPIDGFVRTCKNIDGGILQELWSFGAGVTRKLTRTANLSNNTWNRWAGIGEVIPLVNSWAAYGAPWKGPTATLTENGVVVVEGLIKGGVTTAGTTIGTLPAGMRPTGNLMFDCPANGANVKIQIAADGTISAFSTADGTFTNLSGITFLAA